MRFELPLSSSEAITVKSVDYCLSSRADCLTKNESSSPESAGINCDGTELTTQFVSAMTNVRV